MIKRLLNKLRVSIPILTRVYSFDIVRDLYHCSGSTSWNTESIDERKDLQLKVLGHIKNRPIVYYLSKTCAECSVYTKKYGWCFLKSDYDLNFIEFGIGRSNTRYDIGYKSCLADELRDYLEPILTKMESSYQHDHNL